MQHDLTKLLIFHNYCFDVILLRNDDVFPEPSVVEAMNREKREKEEQEKSEFLSAYQ